MTETTSEQKYDQSIYQDYVLKDDVLTVINPADADAAEGSYEGHVAIYEGDKLLHTEKLTESADDSAYELRLESSQLASIFKPGKKYVMLVYEYNSTIDYKMYIHKETIKIIA